MGFVFFLSSWMPVAVWAALIFYLSGIPGLRTELGIWDLILRKAAHIVEFGIFAGLVHRALKRTWPASSLARHIFWSAAIAVVYAISDEIHQAFVPDRGPSVVDVLVDSFGVALVLVIKFKHEKN